MVPLLVPDVFPPVDLSMQAHMFFEDTWHHPYISTNLCGKCFTSLLYNNIIILLNHFCAIYVIDNLSPKLRHNRITFQMKGHKKLTTHMESGT